MVQDYVVSKMNTIIQVDYEYIQLHVQYVYICRAGHALFLGLRAPGGTLSRSFLGLKFRAFAFALLVIRARIFALLVFSRSYFRALNFLSRYWFPFALPDAFHPRVSIYIHSHTHTLHTHPHTHIHAPLHPNVHTPPHSYIHPLILYIHTSPHTYILYVPTYIRTSPNREHTTYTYIPTYLHPHIHTSLNTYIQYIQKYIHTYIHTNVYLQRQKKREFAIFFFRARHFRFFTRFFFFALPRFF